MSKLDNYSNQLMKVFRKKGGAAEHKISMIMAATDQNATVETRWECVLKALSVYLNENPEKFIKDYVDAKPGAMRAMEEKVMEIHVIRHEGAEPTELPEDVGIIMEGVEVLQDLRDVANGCAVLFGLIYSLNLSYTKDLRYTFEFFQKVLMDLDGNRHSGFPRVLEILENLEND